MRRAIPLLAALVLTAACGTSTEPSDEKITDEALAEAGIPPAPDQATADAYIDALDAINPAIDRDDPESAIERGRNQCSTIKEMPDDRAHQVEMTNMRFTSPDAPEGWGTETAEQILDVVHQHLCPGY